MCWLVHYRFLVVAQGSDIIAPTGSKSVLTSQRAEAIGVLVAMSCAVELVTSAKRITLHVDNNHVVSAWSKIDDRDASLWSCDPSRDLYIQMLSLKHEFSGSLGIVHVKVSRYLQQGCMPAYV